MKAMTTLLKLILPAHVVRNLGNSQEKQIKKAIKDLQALSDRHLSDLGIARSEIEKTVRFGREQAHRTVLDF